MNAGTSPTPVPDPLAMTAVDALAQVSFAVQARLTRVAAAHDLSMTQLRLLGILRDRTPSMAAIADVLELDRSSVSGLIDRAERRGLVARRPSPTDARITLVEATPFALELGARLEAEAADSLGELAASSSADDLAAFVRLAAAVERGAVRVLGAAG
ncbi:MarR family winged helix-turn-helix transcriptional regulator [Subtercola sp. YIM 133946]|uniref:MarR family winged helix-turn-helix transcriptional regulator n=1 Tax=Subtercola sp. YIM 133946 TaxID=3118909 RepID=UPI002F95F8DF